MSIYGLVTSARLGSDFRVERTEPRENALRTLFTADCTETPLKR